MPGNPPRSSVGDDVALDAPEVLVLEDGAGHEFLRLGETAGGAPGLGAGAGPPPGGRGAATPSGLRTALSARRDARTCRASSPSIPSRSSIIAALSALRSTIVRK